MKIDRSNYEIWLIDWLDGNLNDLQTEEVLLFLSHNPDLKEEFEDLANISLKPVERTFKGKTQLIKTTAELTESQFDYLCVASMEKDLSDAQEAELIAVIEQDEEKNKSFRLIQKMKLVPENIIYKNKSSLFKQTAFEKAIRLSVMGLSAAAAIALLFTTYQLIPRTDGLPAVSSISNTRTDGLPAVSSISNTRTDALPSVSSVSSTRKDGLPSVSSISNNRKDGLPAVFSSEIATDSSAILSGSGNDSLIRNTVNNDDFISKINVQAEPNLKIVITTNSLIASNLKPVPFFFDEERSNVGRFIARNFREIFLKEKTPQDSPLKGYEIAEVGVTGLNKLLGWEMALDKNNDENGELKSVYFSSKILKFNTPVKKTEAQP